MYARFKDEAVIIMQLKVQASMSIVIALVAIMLFILDVAYFVELVPFFVAISIGFFITGFFYISSIANKHNAAVTISKIVYSYRLAICFFALLLTYKMLGIF